MLHSLARNIVLAAGGGSLAAAAIAQDAGVERLAPVVVTGSRLAVPGAESASPLQVIDGDDIAATGPASVQEALLKNPTTSSPQVSRTNSNFADTSVGVSTVDLRHLGTARTLVLVNGRRMVAGIPGSSAVDLNVIPPQFIDRIELLTGGASSLYGSDAVAGVVNIITRKHAPGLAVDAQVGGSARGDDDRRQLSLTFGSPAGGRGSLMAHIGLTRQGSVMSRDREASAVDQFSIGAGNGNPAEFFAARRPFFSSFAPQGRFFTANGPADGITFDTSGAVVPWSTNGTDTLRATGFNRSEFRTIAVPTDRDLLAAQGEYAIAGGSTAFFEALHAATRTKSRLEPFFLGSASVYPASGGQVPAEFLVDGVLRRNPLVPDVVFDTATDQDGDGLRDFSFTRRTSEVGDRAIDAERKTSRLVVGLRGTLAGRWSYEAFAARGWTRESQVGSGHLSLPALRDALEAVPDVGDVDQDGDTTEPICRDASARARGCVPISMFGFGSISPGAARYVATPTLLATRTTQDLLGVSLTGEAAMLSAGPVAVAFGAEHRRESSRSTFDALTQAGLTTRNALPNIEGAFRVSELFAEVRAPLLRDRPAAKALDLSAALRASRYSTIGDAYSWNTGIEWRPGSSLKFRATRALATRAPNIGELFRPPSQTFLSGLNDPCLGVTAATPGATADACRAHPGVAANIAANGSFTLNQADLQTITGFDRGNPALEEEKGRSWTLGLAAAPLRDVTLTIDWFSIRIDRAIVPTPRQFILDQCYGGNSSLCQFIARRSTPVGPNSAGSIATIDSAVTNSGDRVTRGFDVTLHRTGRAGPGQLDVRFAWTHLTAGYDTPLPGAARDEFKGEVGSPTNKAHLALAYRWSRFGVGVQSTYIGRSALDDQFLRGFGLGPGSATVSSQVYHDVHLSFSPRQRISLILGVSNLLDRDPPPIISGLPRDVIGTETAADVYDAIGRRYFIAFRMQL